MLVAFTSLFSIWIIFSGYFGAFFIVSGILSSLLVVLLITYYTEIQFYHPSVKWIKYSLWLLYQMFVSAIVISKIVWQKTPRLSPQLLKIQHNSHNDTEITIIANSITLTPGSITVHHDQKHLYVHALIADGTVESVNNMIQKLKSH